MIADVCFSIFVVCLSFKVGISHPSPLAAVYVGFVSALAWAVGSAPRAPVWFGSHLNIIAAGFAAAAVGFSASHA